MCSCTPARSMVTLAQHHALPSYQQEVGQTATVSHVVTILRIKTPFSAHAVRKHASEVSHAASEEQLAKGTSFDDIIEFSADVLCG